MMTKIIGRKLCEHILSQFDVYLVVGHCNFISHMKWNLYLMKDIFDCQLCRLGTKI